MEAAELVEEGQRREAAVFSSEKMTLAEAGAAMTLEAARQVSKSWVCGDRTEFFYLFVNKLSGNEYANRLMDDEYAKRLMGGKGRYTFDLSYVCEDFIVADMNDASALQETVQDMRERVEALKVLVKNPLVRAIAIGGDGSFTRLVDVVQSVNVDLRFVAFGVFPAGTENELARTFGWEAFAAPEGDPLHPQK